MNIPAGEFKAKCLKLMDQVHDFHQEIVITKFGKPVAKLVPIEEVKQTLFGYLANYVKIEGDIIQPIGDAWDVENEN